MKNLKKFSIASLFALALAFNISKVTTNENEVKLDLHMLSAVAQTTEETYETENNGTWKCVTSADGNQVTCTRISGGSDNNDSGDQSSSNGDDYDGNNDDHQNHSYEAQKAVGNIAANEQDAGGSTTAGVSVPNVVELNGTLYYSQKYIETHSVTVSGIRCCVSGSFDCCREDLNLSDC